MTKYSHLFLDFDETLFNHYAFLEWLDNFLADNHKIKSGSFKNSVDDYHKIMGENMRLYSHAEHIEKVTNRNWDFMSGEIEQALNSHQTDFCYPDVHETLRELIRLPIDTRVLTYGDGAYQRFKLNSCHLLHELRLPIHVVTRPKSLFLKKEFPVVKGILVDDKHPLRLPVNWDHMWLDRFNKYQKPVHLADKEHRITSFDQILQLFSFLDKTHTV